MQQLIAVLFVWWQNLHERVFLRKFKSQPGQGLQLLSCPLIIRLHMTYRVPRNGVVRTLETCVAVETFSLKKSFSSANQLSIPKVITFHG